MRSSRRELKTPLQLGENFYGPRECCRRWPYGAGDYVMPDLMRIGGVTGWLRAAADRRALRASRCPATFIRSSPRT